MSYIVGEWFPGTDKTTPNVKETVADTGPINKGGENGTFCVIQVWVNASVNTTLAIGIYDGKGDVVDNKEFKVDIRAGMVNSFGSDIAFPVPNDCSIRIISPDLVPGTVSASIILGTFATY